MLSEEISVPSARMAAWAYPTSPYHHPAPAPTHQSDQTGRTIRQLTWLGKLSVNVTNPSLLVSVESNNQVINSVAPDPRKSGILSEQMERLVWPSVKATGSFIISYLWKFKLKLSKTEGLEQNNVWQRTSLDCVRTTLAVESCFQAWCNLTECCVV